MGGAGESRHFKCCALTDTQVYKCTNDILPPTGMCSESCDLFKFGEISDNVSKTVQDKDMVAMEVYVAY